MDYDGATSPSPSPSPSRSPSPLPIAYPVTVASAPPGHLALAIPIDKHGPSSGGGSGSGAGREDAWSDGATSSLIDAWGERFVALGRGSLRHPQWQEVAEVVSSRDGYSKPPKSDVQCKNRIDTLKKKYKVEKAKSDSSWPFFDRLDFLLAPVHKLGVGGNSAGAAANSGSSNPSNRSTAPMAPRVNFPQRTRTAFPSSVMKRRLPSPPQASASSESSDGFPPEPPAEAVNGKRQRLGDSANGADSGDRLQGLRDLAQAIRRLGETYERVESSKRAHELRIERDRLAAESELEDQRVQFFLKMQMEISKPNNGTPPLAAASMIGNSASTAADGRAAADGNGSRRASMATDVVGSCSHHVQYGVMDDDRHHHASQPPSSQYNNRSNVAADATGTGSGSDSGNKEDKEDEEEEMEDEEEERQ